MARGALPEQNLTTPMTLAIDMAPGAAISGDAAVIRAEVVTLGTRLPVLPVMRLCARTLSVQLPVPVVRSFWLMKDWLAIALFSRKCSRSADDLIAGRGQ